MSLHRSCSEHPFALHPEVVTTRRGGLSGFASCERPAEFSDAVEYIWAGSHGSIWTEGLAPHAELRARPEYIR